MYSGIRDTFRERLWELRLFLETQLSLRGVPPLASHLLCFLAGSLLFEADKDHRIPADILIPWSQSKVEGSFHLESRLLLAPKDKLCRLAPDVFKIWRGDEGNTSQSLFLKVPKAKAKPDLIGKILMPGVRLLAFDSNLKPCDLDRSHGLPTLVP